jgi:hypothetical protein
MIAFLHSCGLQITMGNTVLVRMTPMKFTSVYQQGVPFPFRSIPFRFHICSISVPQYFILLFLTKILQNSPRTQNGPASSTGGSLDPTIDFQRKIG